jgi:unsaturated rhamnogalacturonyl hydrolase
MESSKHFIFKSFILFVVVSSFLPITADETISKNNILSISDKVAEWQINSFEGSYPKDPKGWIAGTLYLGMFNWAQISNNSKYENWLRKIFDYQEWQVGDSKYHADYICVAQTYLDFYSKYKEEKMITSTLGHIDWVIAHPPIGGMDFYIDKKIYSDRWTWCDALFMAPSVYTRLYAITGQKKYIEFANKEYKATYERLFDKEEHLFYRDNRFMTKREPNGEKVFWGRGNGWVLGGLCEILKSLPVSDKKDRKFYSGLLVKMSDRLASLQDKNGFWHASLLDPESYPLPETSATGFMVYGMAYGINNGYLSKSKYLPIVMKGWNALCSAVHNDGKLGYVQPVGDSPSSVTGNTTELYGVGAFLLAACEVYKLMN